MNVLKQNGEANTPFELRQRVLDLLPDSFWQSFPRIFEPCCGSGGFVYDCLDRLLVGHGIRSDADEPFPTNEKWRRYASKTIVHIVTVCIVFADINPENVALTTDLILSHPAVQTLAPRGLADHVNRHVGDALKMFPGLPMADRFDAVITNPPFQMPTEGKRAGGYGGKTLWDRFVVHILENWLRPEGDFLCIHPSAWRKPGHPLWPLLTQRHHMLFLSIHNERDGKEAFHCSTRYDYYHVRLEAEGELRARRTKTTTIVDEKGNEFRNVDLRQWSFLPNYSLPWTARLFDMASWRCETLGPVLFSRSAYGTDKKHVSMERTRHHTFPCVHTMNRHGPGFVWSSHGDNGHFGIGKVILTAGRYQHCPINDYKGEYGMTQITFGLPVESKEEGDRIIQGLQHPVFQEILRATKWQTFYTDKSMFQWLRRDFYKQLLR